VKLSPTESGGTGTTMEGQQMNTKREPQSRMAKKKERGESAAKPPAAGSSKGSEKSTGSVGYGPKADVRVPTLAELRRRLLSLMPEALRVLEYHLKRKSLAAAIFVREGTGVAVRHVRHEGVGRTPNDETVPAKPRVK